MSRIYFKIIFVLMATALFHSIGYCQTNDPEKIKQEFLKVVNKELKSLQDWGLRSKNQPERTLVFQQVSNTSKSLYQSFKQSGMQLNQKDAHLFEDKWKAYYSDWSNDINYDIKKTDSIVSPYIGIVSFRGKHYYKEGKTKEECLSSPWRVITSRLDGSPVIYEPKLKYAYQNGKWILKETPPVYKKY